MKQSKWLGLMAILFILLLVACNNDNSNNDDTEKAGPTPVETAEVEKGDLTAERSLFGRVEPDKKTPVMLEAPGKLKKVSVKNGEKVKKDADLLSIDGPMGEEKIKAPEAGYIANLSAKKDETVSNEEPVLIILDTGKLSADFEVTEKMRHNFKEDDKVEIVFEDEKYDGKITAMDIVPGETGLFPITVEIKNEKNKILTGSVVELIHQEVLEKDTLIVPTAAIISELEENYIYLVENNEVKRIDVEVLETQTDKSAIKADLKKGDEIITKGQFLVKEGSEIEVKKGNES